MKHYTSRYICSFLMAITMLLFCCPYAYAHPVSKEGLIWGGESVGWMINENKHTNGTTLTYDYDAYDPNLSAVYQTYVAYGASRWSGTVDIVRKTDGTAKGLITTEYNSRSSDNAYFEGRTDSSGHLTSGKIVINRYYEDDIDSKVLAHEFGHAIGLMDLYERSNGNKLMYGRTGSNWTATGLHATDRWGARTITGDHDSHPLSFKYYYTDASSNNYHVKYCTECGGLASSPARCVYNANNRCKICGTPKGAQTSALENSMR